MAEQRYYTHSIVSYANIDEIQQLLNQAKAWAYICHDKDVNEDGQPRFTHYHIIATFSQVKSFRWVRSQIQSTENTFTEAIKGEVGDVIDYFTHKGYTDKFQYDESDIVYSDKEYWERRIGNCETTQEDKNNAFVDDLLSPNYSAEAMGRKYGRDFIKNFRSYQSFRYQCLTQRQIEADRKKNADIVEGLNLEGMDKQTYYKIVDGELIPVFERYLNYDELQEIKR